MLINGGSAGFVSYDGVTFFNDAHVSGSSGNQDNDLTYNATDADNPTTDEFKKALKQAIGTMMAMKDDQGEPAPIGATGLVCVVPPTMFFTALESINATVIDNTTNTLNGVARVISMPWLSDASMWYLLKTDGVLRPFIFQDREPVEFNSLTEDSEESFKREKFLYGVRGRYRLTFGYWQFAIRTDFV